MMVEVTTTRAAADRQPQVPAPESAPAPPPFSVLRRFPRGALILAAGAPARSVYVLRAGHARVFMVGGRGRETTTAVLGPGQLLGIAALLGRPTCHAFAEAMTTVEAWAVPAERLRACLAQDPALLSLVVDALGQRFELAQTLLRDVTLLPVAARIPDVLARLEPCLGGQRPRLTREHLAGLVGARPETLSRAAAHAPAPAG